MLSWVRLTLACAAALVGTTAALGQWATESKPLSTDDAMITMTGVVDDVTQVQVWCSKANHGLSFLRYDGKDDRLQPVEVDFDLQADTGRLWSNTGMMYRHEPGWIGMVYNDASQVRAIVEEFIAAKSSIAVTITDKDSGRAFPYQLSAKGSTAAGRQFLDACFGSPAAAPLAPATADAPSWTLNVAPDPDNSGDAAILTGQLEAGRGFFAYCGGDKAVALVLTGSAFPYEVGDVGLNLHVEIDGNDRTSVGEYFEAGEARGVSYTGTQSIESLFRDLAGAQNAVSMRVVDYSDGSDATWRAASLVGLTEAASGFVAHCWGGAPVAMPAVPATAQWAFSQSVDDVTAGYRGVMRAIVGDTLTLRLTCSLDAGTWTIGVFGPLVPAGASGPTLAVDIEGLAWEYPAASASDTVSGQGLVASGGTEISELVPVLSLPREGITVEVVQGGQRTPYRFTAAEPASKAALEMFRKCYALG